MARGEIPTERGDSWFSPKCLEGQPRGGSASGVGRWLRQGAANRLPSAAKPQIPARRPRVRRWGLSFIVERETDQTAG